MILSSSACSSVTCGKRDSFPPAGGRSSFDWAGRFEVSLLVDRFWGGAIRFCGTIGVVRKASRRGPSSENRGGILAT